MDETWYVRIGEEAAGPHTREELESMRAKGQISPATLVWREGSEEWRSYGDSDLAAPTPPPLPTTPLESTHPKGVAIPPEHSAQSRNPIATQEAPLPIAWASESRNALDGVPEFVPVLDHAQTPPDLAVNDDGWQAVSPAPWRRYFGRMFDLLLIGASVWVAISFGLALLSPDSYEALFGVGQIGTNPIVSSILTCVVVMPFSALMIGLTGMSPGKWIFGTRITYPDGRPIGFREALDREVRVLVSGLALGTPLIILITLIRSNSKLKEDGVTKWDEQKPWVVTHRRQGPFQVLLFIVGLLLLTISYGFLQAIGG